MEEHGPVWLGESDVAETVTLNAAVDAVRAIYIEAAKGNTQSVPKALAAWSSGTMHALGSISSTRGLAGFKTWMHTPAGASAVFELFDTSNGRLLALIQAGLLGAIRTNAIAAVATDALAPSDADHVALIGTGRQALLHIAAIGVVRELRRVTIWSPNAERRSAFVSRARQIFPYEIVEADTLEAAVAGAPIVSTVTRARDPFLRAEMLTDGAHINAVGAILPTHAELLPDVMIRAGLVVTDDMASASLNARELADSTAAGGPAATDCVLLEQLLSQPPPPSAHGITVFKPMGSGLSDLAVAALAHDEASRLGLGQRLGRTAIKPPKWTLKQAS